MTLLEARAGQSLRIVKIDDPQMRAQCTRFGIGEGSVVQSAEKLPLGPVLVRRYEQEICVGRGLARGIRVEYFAGP